MPLLPWIGITLVLVIASGFRSGWKTGADFPKDKK